MVQYLTETFQLHLKLILQVEKTLQSLHIKKEEWRYNCRPLNLALLAKGISRSALHLK